MRFGFCTNTFFMNDSVDEKSEKSRRVFDAIVRAGFDYLETQLSDIVDMDKAKYAQFKKELAANNIAVKGGLLLLPRNMPLLTDDMNLDQIKSRAERTLSVAAELGTETAVFAPRRIDENDDMDKALDRMRQILSAIDPLAGKYGVKIAVEPLCRNETNTLNSVQQAADLLDNIKTANTGILCDLYHVKADGRTLDDVIINSSRIVHLHIAYPVGRKMPSSSDDMAEYAEFVKVIKQIGYDGKLSVECGIDEITEDRFKDALAVLKKLFN